MSDFAPLFKKPGDAEVFMRILKFVENKSVYIYDSNAPQPLTKFVEDLWTIYKTTGIEPVLNQEGETK